MDMNGAAVFINLSVASKRLRFTKQELLRRVDCWGQQLPVRLLAGILSFCGGLELARSQAVNCGWQLSPAFRERLWRSSYLADFEAGTAEAAGIACSGPRTPWLERYQRRKRTDQNWRAGVCRIAHITFTW